MPQPTVIEIPGVGVVEFPASMTAQQIEQAAAKLYAEKAPRRTTGPARTEDFVDPPAPARPMATGQRMWQDVADEAKNFVGNAWQAIKPWDQPSDIITGPLMTIAHPLQAVDLLWSALRDAHADQGSKALDAAQRLETAPTVGGKAKALGEAVLRSAATVVPGLGPAVAGAVDQAVAGDLSGGAGRLAGLGASMAVGNRLAKAQPSVRAALPNRNPVMAEAVEFGKRSGIPIDAATATDRPIVARVQKRMSDSMGGAGRAEAFKREQSAALTRTAGTLADKAHPSPMTAEAAGQGVRSTVENNIKQLHKDASTAYDSLRQVEHQRGLTVDVAPAKQALKPLYQQLAREKELVGTLQGGKARTLVALDSLMNGPDAAPLSVVDGALGDLKAMARGAEMPELRTGGQATAASAVKALDAQVRAAASQAGPDVLKALEDGRKATVAKYQAGDVLKGLNDEPVRSFNKLTTREDISVEHLRDVAKQAPGELPKIGRAFLDDLFEKATSDGRFEHAAAIANTWEKLGPQTKAMLFQQPGHVRELDNFFRLARKIAENPNPSGTASQLTAANLTLALPASLVTRLFYSPAGVKLLTEGLTIPTGNTAAAAAFRSRALKVAGSKSAPVPMVAEQDDERKMGAR